MINHSFEIKIALLGYVSVGKTTVLNALFQDRYSEVSMRRTTAGINFFRVSSRKKQSEETNSEEGESWSPDQDAPRDAPSTLRETVADNQELRTANVIQEKVFDIELEEPLFEMRQDTSLVIADIPGLNEAGTCDMYLNYVSSHWDTYDCVVVVMDAEKGVNTEEQVSLLKFVKEKQQKVKNVPVVILCNKVDDPDDNSEIAVLVDEVRAKVEQVFEVDCRKAALNRILSSSSVPKPTSDVTKKVAPPEQESESKDTQPENPKEKTKVAPPKQENETKDTQPEIPEEKSSGASSDSGTNADASTAPFGSGTMPPKFGNCSGFTFSGSTSSSFEFGSPSLTFNTSSQANPFAYNKATSFGTRSPEGAAQSGGFTFSPEPQVKTTMKRLVRAGRKRHYSFPFVPTTKGSDSPVFIPISAENAFIYRTVSHLPFEEFKKLDKDIIERLGREEAGRIRWKAMSLEEKYKVVHDAVGEPSAYEERLERTNFDAFMKTLSHFVGGEHNQTKLLEKQIDIAVKKLSGSKTNLAGQLRSIYERSKVLGKPTTGFMKSHFWILYKAAEAAALGNFFTSMSPHSLCACIDELAEYSSDQYSVLYADGTDKSLLEEKSKIVSTMKDMVKRQIAMILAQYSTWKIEESSMMNTGVAQLSERQSSGHPMRLTLQSPNGRVSARYTLDQNTNPKPPESNPFYWKRDASGPVEPTNTASPFVWRNTITGATVKSRKNPELPAPTWSNLSPDDWIAIVNSISLLIYEQHFSENFGPELNELELLKAELTPLLANGTRKQYLSGTFNNFGDFTPSDPTKYSLVKQLDIPGSPSQPEHWGHLAYKFCKFMKSHGEQ